MDYNKIEKAKSLIKTFFQKHPEIDDSHGFKHAEDVETISINIATVYGYPKDSREMFIIRLVSLLHDVEDSKYKSDEVNIVKNIMLSCDIENDIIEEVLFYINKISVSKNSDSGWVPNKFYQIISRSADRYTAGGVLGIIRCIQYNTERMRKGKGNMNFKVCTPGLVYLKKFLEEPLPVNDADFKTLSYNIKRSDYDSMEDLMINRVIPLFQIEIYIYKTCGKDMTDIILMFENAIKETVYGIITAYKEKIEIIL